MPAANEDFVMSNKLKKKIRVNDERFEEYLHNLHELRFVC